MHFVKGVGWGRGYIRPKGSKSDTAKIPLINSIKVNGLSEESTLLFLPSFSVGVHS